MNKIEQILDIIKNDDDCFAVYGIRKTYGDYEVGDKMDNSFVWHDGEMTDEELDGVSTMGIDRNTEDAVINAIKNLGRDACEYFGVDANVFHTYFGKNFVLVKGDYATGGQDRGESVIANPVVLAIFQ